MYHIRIIPYLLKFKQPAGTSRGTYTSRQVWYVLLTADESPGRWGLGECAPLPGLSCEALPGYEQKLRRICRKVEQTGYLDNERLRSCPSILFGLETAFHHFKKGSFTFEETSFAKGSAGIPVNGLIWMGDYDSMLRQIESKLKLGFRCMKLKIGAIGFDEEIALLRHIRNHFSANDVELRVDANGAFSPRDILDKLNRLAAWEIHSIEQPIAAGQWEAMAQLCEQSPVPVALDEELIGHNRLHDKSRLLEIIQPQYLILKPSLHGGVSGCNEWIALANRLQTGWWITSALESNVGLHAIAQWCASLNNPLPQGLGTGGLYSNNMDMPLYLQNDCLFYDPQKAVSAHHSFFSFLAVWTDGSSELQVQTSGSTGAPRQIAVKKEQMMQSALLTCSLLGMQAGDTALLCMPLQYIGAKMMVVRALATDLSLLLCRPSGHPLADVALAIDLAAMTPQQVYNSLQVPAEKERLMNIRRLIIGGASVNAALEKELSAFPHHVYATYGMTETVSHIALRRLNGKEASPYYTPFPVVKLSLSEDHTLVIEAPFVLNGKVKTNDIADLMPDGRFRILGRTDHVINSGGMKIQTEALEDKLRSVIAVPLAVTAVKDARFGEKVTLLTEQDIPEQQQAILKSRLLPCEYPKVFITVSRIPYTPNGKIDRMRCQAIARRYQMDRR
ncbi:MAG: AMP-binding protein [Tannerella sp.]|jgi:o-succinylbenzoate synthase|nr:AMP-binding protein [Tannerella sp.]